VEKTLPKYFLRRRFLQTEKVGDLKEMLSENDEGLKEVLRRLFGTLSKDLDRRFESLFFNLEEKWSLQNSQQHEKELSK